MKGKWWENDGFWMFLVVKFGCFGSGNPEIYFRTHPKTHALPATKTSVDHLITVASPSVHSHAATLSLAVWDALRGRQGPMPINLHRPVCPHGGQCSHSSSSRRYTRRMWPAPIFRCSRVMTIDLECSRRQDETAIPSPLHSTRLASTRASHCNWKFRIQGTLKHRGQHGHHGQQPAKIWEIKKHEILQKNGLFPKNEPCCYREPWPYFLFMFNSSLWFPLRCMLDPVIPLVPKRFGPNDQNISAPREFQGSTCTARRLNSIVEGALFVGRPVLWGFEHHTWSIWKNTNMAMEKSTSGYET